MPCGVYLVWPTAQTRWRQTNSSAPTPLPDTRTCSAEVKGTFLNLVLPVKPSPALFLFRHHSAPRAHRDTCAHAGLHGYLDGVIENQGVKLCQVLHMVALNYVVVLSHQTSQLLHVVEQLCHLAGGEKGRGDNRNNQTSCLESIQMTAGVNCARWILKQGGILTARKVFTQ